MLEHGPTAQPCKIKWEISDKIILLESVAKDNVPRDSEVDLLLVDPAQADQRWEGVRLGRQWPELGNRFDMVIISTEWFQDSKNVTGKRLPLPTPAIGGAS